MRLFWLPKRRESHPADQADQARPGGQAEALLAEKLRAEGAQCERERIRQIHGALFIEGHDALVASMLFDGKSSVADVALAVVNAENARLRDEGDARAEAWYARRAVLYSARDERP